MVNDGTARRPIAESIASKSTHRPEDQRHFVFYDSYYESLLQRKRERDCLNAGHHILSLPTQAALPVGTNIEPINLSFLNPSKSVSESRNEQLLIPTQDQLNLSLIHSANEIPDAVKVALLQKAMRTLYIEIDRQKAQVTEVMAREARAVRELTSLRRKVKADTHVQTVSIEEFRELEAKYTNAVKLIDDLNWRLNKLPDDLT